MPEREPTILGILSFSWLLWTARALPCFAPPTGAFDSKCCTRAAIPKAPVTGAQLTRIGGREVRNTE